MFLSKYSIFYFRGQPRYSAESSYKPSPRKVSHPMEVTGYKGYAADQASSNSFVIKDVFVNKDVYMSKDLITPIESKTMDLIAVDSYKVINIY